MCRVANAVRVLSALFLAIHPPAIADVVRCSREWGVPPKDMLGTGFLRRTLERETERRIAREGADERRVCECPRTTTARATDLQEPGIKYS